MTCENLLNCAYASTMLGLIWLIFIPMEIYFVYIFVQYEYHPAIRLRYPEVVIAIVVFCMLHTAVAETFYYLKSGIAWDVLTKHPNLEWAFGLFIPPILLLVTVTIVFRFWLVFYNLKYVEAQSKYEWQTLLRGTAQKENNWFFKHLNTYGNWKYAKRYAIGYFIIGSFIEIAATICELPSVLNMPSAYSSLIYLLVLTPSFVVIGPIVVCKMPKIRDSFFVRWEAIALIIVNASAGAVYALTIVLGAESGNFLNEVNTTALGIVSIGIPLVSTAAVLRKVSKIDGNMHRYREIRTRARYRQLLTQGSALRLQRALSLSNTFDKTEDIQNLMRDIKHFGDDTVNVGDMSLSTRTLFNVIVSHKDALNLFMSHALSEFAIENILGFIEIIQFLYNVTNQEWHQFCIRPFTHIEYEMARCIPISSCNANYDKNVDNWTDVVLAIYDKYIHESAEFQLNLPHCLASRCAEMVRLLRIKKQTESNSPISRVSTFLSALTDEQEHTGVPVTPVTPGDDIMNPDLAQQNSNVSMDADMMTHTRTSKSAIRMKLHAIANSLVLIDSKSELCVQDPDPSDIEHAKELGKQHLVQIMCEVLSNVLHLSYQSVSRFKSTDLFKRLLKSANMAQLAQQYSEKGAARIAVK